MHAEQRIAADGVFVVALRRLKSHRKPPLELREINDLDINLACARIHEIRYGEQPPRVQVSADLFSRKHNNK